MMTMRQSVLWNRVNRVLLYLGIAVLFILVVFPFYWMIVTSLQPQDAVFSVPPQLWPKHMTFQNYIDAWNAAPWLRYFGNTLFAYCRSSAATAPRSRRRCSSETSCALATTGGEH